MSDDDWMSDDGIDDDDEYLSNSLRIETIDGCRFCDVLNVKIFSKEIRLGKL